MSNGLSAAELLNILINLLLSLNRLSDKFFAVSRVPGPVTVK